MRVERNSVDLSCLPSVACYYLSVLPVSPLFFLSLRCGLPFFPFSSAACCLGPLDSLLSLQQQQPNVTSQSCSKRTSAADKNPKRAEILPLKVS